MTPQSEACPTPSASPEAPAEEKPKTPTELIFDALWNKDWKESEEVLRKNLPLVLRKAVQEAKIPDYNILLFLDQSNPIGEDHADRIYSALSSFEERKDVLLIIGSRGGRIEPAYLISKNAKAAAKSRFVIVVPRRAKSAATLLALGADEIHMGAMSELGPIDPQLGRIPALSLTNALDTIANLVTKYPGSADMFAKYLQNQLDLGILGYFERINESAIQYGTRLLQGKTLGGNKTALELASHLVNHYKDHSFVIDKDEVLQLFGSEILKIQTKEYIFANSIDQDLRWFSRFAKLCHRKVLTYVGSFDSCMKLRDVTQDDE